MKHAQATEMIPPIMMCVTFLKFSIYYIQRSIKVYARPEPPQKTNNFELYTIIFFIGTACLAKLMIIIMIKNSNWVQSSISSRSKKAHNAPIISIAPFDEKLFFTSSQDHTVRLWDLRLHSSVKLFKNQQLKNLTNCDSDRKVNLFVGSGEFVYSFDIRKENIFVEEVNKKNEDAHFDELSVIKVDPNQCIVAAGDDEGDARLYNYDLECVELLDQGHLNIVNTIEFVKTEKENLCLTAGYDSKIVHWDVQSGKIVREIDLQQLFKKHQIKFSTPPFIYCIHFSKNTIYVTTESGHVIAFPVKQPKKPKYILQASMSKILQLRVPGFNENLFITLSYYDGSISLFDHTKRLNGGPLFLQKYKCLQHPTWLEIMGQEMLISYNSTSELTFFLVK